MANTLCELCNTIHEQVQMCPVVASACYPPESEDEIPLTSEWMWSHVAQYHVSKSTGRSVVNTAQFGYCSGGGYCSLESDLGYGSDIDLNTRGDVRKLCDVLRIKYKTK